MNQKLLIFLFSVGFSLLFAQSIDAKLGGDTESEAFEVIDSNDNILLKVQGDGDVGIGVDDPNEKLEVNGTITSTGFTMPTGATDGEFLKTDATGNASWESVPSSADNLGNHTATQNLDIDGNKILLNGGWLSGDGGNNEGIIIDNSGNVGIGWDAATPKSKLHVDGTITVNRNIQADDTGGLHFLSSDGTDQVQITNTGGVYIGMNNTDQQLWIKSTSNSQPTIKINQSGTHNGLSSESVGTGVYGKSTTNNGVYGQSTSGEAVYGTSDSNTGVEGHSQTGDGVYGQAHGAGDGVSGFSQEGHGVYGRTASTASDDYAGYFDGKVKITGALFTQAIYKDAGSFRIDHPLDPANKYLSHSFVESPDMMNVYNGIVEIGKNGTATVELPIYFEALNREFRYQLTCIGGYAPVYIAKEIKKNKFKIAGGKSGLKVSWQVTGIRNDPYAIQNPIIIEEDKKGIEVGKYQNPDAYGLPDEMGIDFDNEQNQ